MKIYFAAPLFSLAEKEFNQKLCDKLESEGFNVFLPQRDGVEKSCPPYDSMTDEERRSAMFQLDKEKIFGCDVFLFVLDGRVPDEGACVELGIAFAHRELSNTPKTLIGLHTDIRGVFPKSKLNPMIKIPLDYIAENENELIEYLKSLS